MKYSKTLLIVLIISLLINICAQYPALKNHYVVNDDVRQRLFFVPKLHDAELFPDDIVTEFYSSSVFSPQASVFLYYLLGFLFPVPVASKIVPFFLTILTCFYLFKIGLFIRDKNSAILLSLLGITHFWSMILFSGGLQRAIAMPLVVAFLYYFLKKDYLKMGVVLVIEALFYQPVFLLCGLSYFISLFKIKDVKKLKKTAPFFFVAVMLGVLVNLPVLFFENPDIGPLVSYEEASAMPEFGPYGWSAVFFDSIDKGILSDDSDDLAIGLKLYNLNRGYMFNLTGVGFLFIISLALMFFLRKKSFSVKSEAWVFLVSGILLYILGYIFLFREFFGGAQLYAPSKYLKYSLSPFLLIFIAENFGKFCSRIRDVKLRQTIFLFFFALIFVFYATNFEHDLVECEHPDLYNYLASLPKDSLFSGHPGTMDCVPLYASRKVLFSREFSAPYYKNFYNVVKERTYEGLSAFYSSSPQEIIDFCSKFGVTHLVVDNHYFSDDYFNGGRLYFQPFDDHIREIIETKDFALEDVSREIKEFDNGKVFVVSCYNLQ